VTGGRPGPGVGRRGRRLLAVVLASALGGACASGQAAAPAPRTPAAAPATGPPRLGPTRPPEALAAVSTPLARELDAIFASPILANAIVGAVVQSVDTGEILYRLNPDTLLIPASNVKIVTVAVAAERLGWNYRYETRLEVEAGASIEGGTLHGDLFVTGTGDPTINARSGDPAAALRELAAALRAAGIRRISGRLVGDDDAFEDERFGAGWAWDDFAFGYAAPVGALQFHENLVEVVVRPGAAEGEAASVELRPAESDLVALPAVTTAPAGSDAELSLSRFPGRPELVVRGRVPAGGKEEVRSAAVDNPTLFFVRALRRVLAEEGIEVAGEAVDIDDLDGRGSGGPDRAAGQPAAPGEGGRAARRVLARHESPPLSEIAGTLMKASQNLYAETVFRTLSARPGPASVEASRAVVEATLRGWGLAPGQFVIADGSGLSRLNFLSTSAIARILRVMALDPRHAEAFAATLPVAGREGTLARRMRATLAEGNAAAKTGTLSNVRALSGYVRSRGGERLLFSIVANHFTAPTSAVDAIVDLAVERLAHYERPR
jgi:D-alanyl-D-alanine carboxypeptidase/D-alanyl-D-alanine-endopeptidase (penicillin-binding protein 4)